MANTEQTLTMIFANFFLRVVGIREEFDIFSVLFLQQACVSITLYFLFSLSFLCLYQLKKQREHAQLVIDHERLRAQHRDWVLAYNAVLLENQRLISDRLTFMRWCGASTEANDGRRPERMAGCR